jgi:predicted transglutaminase-like cysteine proteinase
MLHLFRQKAELHILPNLTGKVRGVIGVFCFVIMMTANVQDSQALEYTGGAQYVTASLSPIMPRHETQINLFGYSEERYSDISAFTKWNGVLDRVKHNLMSSLNQKPVQKWLMFLDSLKNASKQEQIEAVNHYMNQIKFISDAANYGVQDYWATPMEFLARGGDCEDYAIAKYVSLRALGFSKDELRLVIVNDRVMRAPHAMLAVYNDGQAKILDNQNPAVMSSADITRYIPVYSISQTAWWRHS